jgi:predicted esterase
VRFAHEARDRARAAGADVLYRETDVPHMIDPRVVPGLVEWLAKRFG